MTCTEFKVSLGSRTQARLSSPVARIRLDNLVLSFLCLDLFRCGLVFLAGLYREHLKEEGATEDKEREMQCVWVCVWWWGVH